MTGPPPAGAERFWKLRWTIAHQLTLLVLAVLLPFAALVAFSAQEDYRTEQARIQARALRLARDVSAEVDQFVADTAALAEALAHVPSIKRAEEPQSSQLLGELADRYSYYESIFLTDTEGNVLAWGGDDVTPPGNLRGYVRQTLQQGGTIITNPIAPRNTGRHVFVVTAPVWDENGVPFGVVAISVNLLRLQEGMSRADLPDNSSVLIVDKNGRIVARRTDPERWIGRSALDSSAVRNALRLGVGVSEGDFVDGVRRLSGFASAQRVPWEVIVGIPTNEAYGALRRELWRSMARLALTGVMAGIAAWVLGRRLARPIRRLAAGARAYAQGDLTHRIAVDGPEELAALAHTLNHMAAALQQQMEALREARRREREAGERAVAELRRLHSEFIAVAAHELRTPVAAAKSYAELLMRDDLYLSPQLRQQALGRLNAVCERLARLVRSLLGASRIQAGRLEVQLQPVDVAALVRRVLDEFGSYDQSHDLQLTLDGRAYTAATAAGTEPPGYEALGDPERIEDVLVNLLSNASKYSPSGTAIEVEVRRAPGSAPALDGAAIEVRVTDHGPGIPKEEQAAVFERFRRGRGATAGGVGLGLYIAQAYVEAMHGTIGVESTPGHGATFWFCLPATTVAVPLERAELVPAATLAAPDGNGLEQQQPALSIAPNAAPDGAPSPMVSA